MPPRTRLPLELTASVPHGCSCRAANICETYRRVDRAGEAETMTLVFMHFHNMTLLLWLVVEYVRRYTYSTTSQAIVHGMPRYSSTFSATMGARQTEPVATRPTWCLSSAPDAAPIAIATLSNRTALDMLVTHACRDDNCCTGVCVADCASIGSRIYRTSAMNLSQSHFAVDADLSVTFCEPACADRSTLVVECREEDGWPTGNFKYGYSNITLLQKFNNFARQARSQTTDITDHHHRHEGQLLAADNASYASASL